MPIKIPPCIINNDDIQFEQTLVYDIKSIKTWSLYVQHVRDRIQRRAESYLEIQQKELILKENNNRSELNFQNFIKSYLKDVSYLYYIYERALFHLPGSYKLWWKYIQERLNQITILDKIYLQSNSFTSNKKFDIYYNSREKGWSSIFQLFDRALRTMHKMPLIWIEYIKVLNNNGNIVETIRIFNRALQALPISQHELLWKFCIKNIISSQFIPKHTVIRLMDRYVKLNPQYRINFIDILLKNKWIDDIIKYLLEILNFDNFLYVNGTTRLDIWKKLCDVITENPNDIKEYKVEDIIRGGLNQFQIEVANLWCTLATYYIKIGQFEKCRDVYEEAIQNVNTVRDFTIVFDTYLTAEEEIMNYSMNLDGDDDFLHIQLTRLERLVERRKSLLNSVKLRQNPNNIYEWHECIKINWKDPSKVLSIYSKALMQVDPKQAPGQSASLWISFANYYWRQFNDIESSRSIYEKAILEPFSTVQEFVDIWKSYAEMEICNGNVMKAKNLIERSLKYTSNQLEKIMSKRSTTNQYKPQEMLFLNTELWALRIDLEEILGDLNSIRKLYEESIDLKIATPSMILHYAQLLEDNKYFEDSFKAYERSLNLFTYPQNYVLWSTYLTKFISRYSGTQIERTRDIFEQILRSFPHRNEKNFDIEVDPYYARDIYLLYAEFEEKYGLIKRAISIYNRGLKSVPLKVVSDLYIVYINRTSEYFGAAKTREIFEDAILNVPRNEIPMLCLRYVELERKIGEIDRARAIFVGCAKYCNPNTEKEFWIQWEKFEEEFTNFDAYREMLRIKKSVSMTYTSAISFTSGSNVDSKRVAQAIKEGNLEEMKDIIKFHDEI